MKWIEPHVKKGTQPRKHANWEKCINDFKSTLALNHVLAPQSIFKLVRSLWWNNYVMVIVLLTNFNISNMINEPKNLMVIIQLAECMQLKQQGKWRNYSTTHKTWSHKNFNLPHGSKTNFRFQLKQQSGANLSKTWTTQWPTTIYF